MNRWDVYWAEVPFEEDPSQRKTRPVIIAQDRTVYVLTLRVTSHDPRENDPYDYPLQEWKSAGLSRPSVVRIRKMAQLSPEQIGTYIGRLHPVDMVGIQIRMQAYRKERDACRKRG
ncbi:MAG: type II toxin-antitoxin system PemK/MazF family toxin [Eubacteriales bacterium]|nr:type II toxin-antitoxin system PemK/MazF family toxin [Eubacteriales bacterium]